MNIQTIVGFGELLKVYRLAAGLTQEALAERAGVSARNIQNLERGENRPHAVDGTDGADAKPYDERDLRAALRALAEMQGKG